jgi:hypothetical protein
MQVRDENHILYELYTFVAIFLTIMNNPVYLEKDSATIYEELSLDDDDYDDDERASDRMDDMISRYGSY